jgi:hypothetical protein
MTKNQILADIKSSQFSLAEAHKIQREHLTEWAKVLKTSVYLALLNHAIESNKSVTNPYDVFRGSRISAWVQNYALANSNTID